MIHIHRKENPAPKPIPPVQDLKFGKYFTDHWFYAKFAEDRGWYEAHIEPYGKMELDPAAAALHYGQALFEGMKAFRRQDGEIALFRPDFNVTRMRFGAERLCLEAPPGDLFMQGLKQLITLDERWVLPDDFSSLYIRPTLIGSEGFLGVRPSREVLFFIILSPVGPYYSRGQAPTRIWVEENAIRAAPGGLGATKAGANYAAGLQSAFEAKKKGYDQVLWLDTAHDGVEEVGTMNVFWVFKNEVVTPELNGSILNGGMRDSVLRLLTREGLNPVERRITMTEIVERHGKGDLLEAFGTGTAAVISPIGELYYQGQSLVINENRTGDLSHKLYQTITDIQRGRSKDPYGWIKLLKEI